ncbi:MAG: hypothetical protein ACRDHN_08725 [Thermomicrobiales bacterium]
MHQQPDLRSGPTCNHNCRTGDDHRGARERLIRTSINNRGSSDQRAAALNLHVLSTPAALALGMFATSRAESIAGTNVVIKEAIEPWPKTWMETCN